MNTCTVEGCAKEIVVKSIGMCMKHYKRLKRHGSVEVDNRTKGKKCSTDGCDRSHHARGLCQLCYNKQKYHANKNLEVV